MAKRRKPSKASLFPDRFSSEIIRWKDGDTTRIKTNFDQVAARKKFKVVVQSLSGNVELGEPPDKLFRSISASVAARPRGSLLLPRERCANTSRRRRLGSSHRMSTEVARYRRSGHAQNQVVWDH